MKAVDVKEGSIRTICETPAGRGGSWGTDGTILFTADKYGGIYQVPAEGGTPKLVTDDPSKDGISYRWPQFLPDQKHFLYTSFFTNERKILLSSLDSPKGTLLLKADSQAIFVKPDSLIFARNGKLMTQSLDLSTLRMKGEPISITNESITVNLGRATASFTASQNGVLSYQAHSVGESPLIWVDRTGKMARSFISHSEISSGNLQTEPAPSNHCFAQSSLPMRRVFLQMGRGRHAEVAQRR